MARPAYKVKRLLPFVNLITHQRMWTHISYREIIGGILVPYVLLCPGSLRGMILFYEGVKLRQIYFKLITSSVKLNALSEPLNGWPETGGQSGG
jgi:hypothetical protein